MTSHSNNIDIQYTPVLSVSEEYEANSVTVTVDWAQAQQLHITYSVKVSPLVPIMFTGSTSCRLTIQYNTEYNFGIEATTPCRPNATAFIILHYGEIYYNTSDLYTFMLSQYFILLLL